MLVSSSTIHTSVLHTIDTYIVLYTHTSYMVIVYSHTGGGGDTVVCRFMEFDHHRIIFIPSSTVVGPSRLILFYSSYNCIFLVVIP